ncbi:single-stranded DNA-binding protein [Eubacteriales bacterium OttesenSCG-928-N13]|nr:single-stranded DNA-binding protein [Eubacteriales bacterium OttesenSCG-928-N13]
MNHVHLSGTIFDEPKLVNKPGAAPHLTFRLVVRHHAIGGVQKELYRISAWNACATYCAPRLKRDMRIALQGYLAQRQIPVGDNLFTAVEVTMSEVFLPALEQKPVAPAAPEEAQEPVEALGEA